MSIETFCLFKILAAESNETFIVEFQSVCLGKNEELEIGAIYDFKLNRNRSRGTLINTGSKTDLEKLKKIVCSEPENKIKKRKREEKSFESNFALVKLKDKKDVYDVLNVNLIDHNNDLVTGETYKVLYKKYLI